MKKFTDLCYYSKRGHSESNIQEWPSAAAWLYGRHGHLMRARNFKNLRMYDLRKQTFDSEGEKFFLDKVRLLKRINQSDNLLWWYKERKIQHIWRMPQVLDRIRKSDWSGRQAEAERKAIVSRSQDSRNIFEMGVEVCYELTGLLRTSLPGRVFLFFWARKAQVLNQALRSRKALKFAGIPIIDCWR